MKFSGLIQALLAVAVIVLFYLSFNSKRQQVYIDTSKIMQGYQKMQQVEKEIEQKTKMYQANLDTLRSEFEEQMKTYNRDMSTMSAKEKKLSEELLTTKKAQLIQYQQAIQQKALDEANTSRQRVTEEINGKISKFGQAKEYDFIFGTANGNIVYAADKVDVTDEVLNFINEN